MRREVIPIVLLWWIAGSHMLGETTIDKDIAAYQRIFDGTKFYLCFVQVGPSGKWNRLLIQDQETGRRVIEFDPNHNYFIRWSTLDLTGDGQDELVTVWTHGMVREVAIFAFLPRPRLIFRTQFRFGVFFQPRWLPSFKMRMLVYSSSGIQGDILEKTYGWSLVSQEFLLEETRVVEKGEESK